MSSIEVKDSDIAVLIAAIQSSIGPIQVDAEKVAKQLGMSLSSIPPKFTAIRKRYNIDIKVVNSGALQKKKPNSPKKRQSGAGDHEVRRLKSEAQDVGQSQHGGLLLEQYAQPNFHQGQM
ncbi:hypothetical protein PV08_08937 [Exophiala spinifera]|uniref:Uncharacterized protein n=1 Tax=Exophiala spinifera TaxID=91928 RepID=A0A0D1YF75_9EURO|nr:uncharacterized protein PV08_08937 [Exophiala spinifera]KIW13746.1 hypothetical protein PV08_08937 [Exophiala spinifera]